MLKEIEIPYSGSKKGHYGASSSPKEHRMTPGKIILIALIVVALTNPLLWRIVTPLLAVGFGLGIWYLAFHGIASLLKKNSNG